MLKIAIVGATGIVGSTFLKVLEEKNIIAEYSLFASNKSKGKIVKFFNKNYEVKELTKDSCNDNYNYALFSAGKDVAKDFAPLFAKKGTIVIDNSSYFRMDKSVPLIVPEVNMEDAYDNLGIISSPNCSTIQAVMPLKTLDDKYRIKRIVYTTFQAVSGAGKKGIDDLLNKTNNAFKYDISSNIIPQIDIFQENGYTNEEIKMINETRKILRRKNLNITATCVRVPILNSHSESINVEFEQDFKLDDIKQLLNCTKNVIVVDDISKEIYPINTIANNTDDVYVGRIRRDYSVDSGINFWCVADNIRRGAASNAVEILENLIKKRT